MLETQIGKSAGHYRFNIGKVEASEGLPFMSASALNNIRRRLAEKLGHLPVICRQLQNTTLGSIEPLAFLSDKVTYKLINSRKIGIEEIYRGAGAAISEKAYEITPIKEAELMRTKYCVRYELGMCPKHHGSKTSAPLFLLNNGKRLALHFDCINCEMSVTEA